jgi:hypothetical protein
LHEALLLSSEKSFSAAFSFAIVHAAAAIESSEMNFYWQTKKVLQLRASRFSLCRQLFPSQLEPFDGEMLSWMSRSHGDAFAL